MQWVTGGHGERDDFLSPEWTKSVDQNCNRCLGRVTLSPVLERLPSVEDCQQRPTCTAPIPMIAITGIDDRNQTESVIAIHRNAHHAISVAQIG